LGKVTQLARAVWAQARTPLFPVWSARAADPADRASFLPVVTPALLPMVPGKSTSIQRRVVNRLERRAFRMGRPGDFPPEVGLRRLHGVLRAVTSEPGITPEQAVSRNRDVVVRLCEENHLDYFAVPEPNARRHRLGIASRDWDSFIALLADYGRSSAVYASVRAKDLDGRRTRMTDLVIHPVIQHAIHSQRRAYIFTLYAPTVSNKPGPVYGEENACLVECWNENEDGSLQAPIGNTRTSLVGGDYRRPVYLRDRPEAPGTPEPVASGGVRTLTALADPEIFDIRFPIDIVYTWVDGADPVWRERKRQTLAAAGIETHPGAANIRFLDNGELRYSLRSVEQFAPWARNIYLVTDNQVPSWLDPSQTRVTLVDHRDIFPADALPTFNSHSIGARLHHIDGLSENYVHFNDDFFLGRPVRPETFFDSNGVSKFFLSRTATLGFQGLGEALPHEQARRNVVELLARDFGFRPSRIFQHTPITQRRSVFFELEERYPEAMERTWRSRLRDHTDFEPNSWLHHYYGYLRGYTRPSRIPYAYFEAGGQRAWDNMQRVYQTRSVDTFCINESEHELDAADYLRTNRWLQRYFPTPASFELPGA
jgi:hypothetical protein